MFVYQKFLIRDNDRFASFDFPQLETNLAEVVIQLGTETSGPKADMLLSFVRDHSINAQSAEEHPKLAALISSGTLPLRIMEDLFESSRNNLTFRNDLEAYIKSCLLSQQVQSVA